MLSDQVVIALARRNGGVKEPEMRLYTLVPCFVFAAVGYMLYGWGAQTEAHWITIAIGIGAMISHQVGACTIATAYAMDCFPGVSHLTDSISRRRLIILDIWRASRCTGYVLLNGQFRHLVLCPAVYRSSRLWLDYDLLWYHGLAVGCRRSSSRRFWKKMEGRQRAEILQVFG